MFTSPRQKAYMAAFKGCGDDEEKSLQLTFYLTPITYELASEIDPHLADRLFRKNGGDWLPAQEMPKASFSSIQIPKQNVAFHPHDQETLIDSGILVQSVAISNLRAARAFPDKPDFRLEFEALIPMNRDTMDLVRTYFKGTVFLTCEPAQDEMNFEGETSSVMDLLCRLCEAPNPEWATHDNKFAYCDKHKENKQDGEQLHRIRDLAAAAAVTREPGDESENEGREDPLADEAAFINSRNKGGRKKRA